MGVGLYTYQGTFIGLFCHRAPEIAMGSSSYTCKCDIWSCGIIMAEMVLGELPFFCKTPDKKPIVSTIGYLFDMFTKLGTPTIQDWPEMAALPSFSANFIQKEPDDKFLSGFEGSVLVKGMLTYNPQKRVSASHALMDAFW